MIPAESLAHMDSFGMAAGSRDEAGSGATPCANSWRRHPATLSAKQGVCAIWGILVSCYLFMILHPRVGDKELALHCVYDTTTFPRFLFAYKVMQDVYHQQ